MHLTPLRYAGDLLVPALRARTRYNWTGHREPHNQNAFACTAHGAGQDRDYMHRLVIMSD